MSVVSNENKEMLWDLIIDICNDNSFQVNGEELKQFLDGRCGYYHGQRFEFPNFNLNDINKEIIGQCYNFILSKQQNTRINKSSNIKMQDPLNKRELFNKNLAEKQKAFEDGITLKKPKEIDFSDGGEDFPIGNLDVIMNQTLADRQKELEQITSKYSKSQQEEATRWLNNSETPKIKIFDNVSVENEVIKQQKKVRFEVKEKGEKNAVTNFFSKLKMKKEDNNDIIEKLDIIISNQEKILKLLQKRDEDEKDVIPSYEAI
tara:strand:- start:3483 stop:4265 length:783 start_codon:yes stop_codon:yes gene_type:complete